MTKDVIAKQRENLEIAEVRLEQDFAEQGRLLDESLESLQTQCDHLNEDGSSSFDIDYREMDASCKYCGKYDPNPTVPISKILEFLTDDNL